MRSMVSDCVKTHKECSCSISGESIDDNSGVRLPTRLIEVGSFRQPKLRLIETNGAHGRYTTLSHCWGPKEHQPIRTLRSNLPNFRHGIPPGLFSLSKTFEHAVQITREIGLEHIWIDSLCIIQDDPDDWERESVLMCDIYQNSYFNIVAAHARDSREGCFYDRQQLNQPRTVKVPYIGHDGRPSGSFLVRSKTPTSLGAEDPWNTATRKRAWILQEELLARRLVHYTKAGMYWMCRKFEVLETGETSPYHWRKLDWTSIACDYSARLLAYQKDKLRALSGVADAIGRLRPDDHYLVGLWQDSLPEQLMWYGISRLDHIQEISLPSWTWASRTGKIGFLSMGKFAKECRTLRVEDSKTVVAEAPILPLVSVLQPSELRGRRAGLVSSEFAGYIGYILPSPLDKHSEGDAEWRSEVKVDIIFDYLGSLLAQQTGQHFGWNDTERVFALTDMNNMLVGYCTLDNVAHVQQPQEFFYCLPIIKGDKSDLLEVEGRRWYFDFALVLQTITGKRESALLKSMDGVSFVRVGIAIVITYGWTEIFGPRKVRIV